MVGKPGMLQVGAHQYQFEVGYFVHMVSHYPSGTPGIFNKIQFKLFVVVQWEIEFGLYPRKSCKTIVLGEWGYFPEQFVVQNGLV
jgi:hypothetical protein